MQQLDVMQALSLSYQRIGQPKRIVLGFSGGSDSAALFHALLKLKETEHFDLLCVHVHHGLRPESVDEEAQLVKLTQKHQVPLLVKRVEVSRQGNLENAAREARYAAFECALNHFQADVLALAHHGDDQAETMLMHLMRGSGAQGMSGMKEWSPPYWRPLLATRKTAINQFLADNQIHWLKDASNFDKAYLRNYLRHTILPALEERQEGSVDSLLRFAEILTSEQEAWAGMEEDFLQKHAKLDLPFAFLETPALLLEHIAFQRRLIRRLANFTGCSLSFEQTERLLYLTRRGIGQKVQLSKDTHAFFTKKRLHILPEAVHSMTTHWQQPGVLSGFAGLGDGLHEQTIDARFMEGAVMRQVDRDDRIIPLGLTGSQSLRKYLSGKGIDQTLRPFWPVFARGHQVLWVPGCGVSQEAAVSAVSVQTVTLKFLDLLPDEIERRH